MSEQFEVSLKNKQVRMQMMIMGPAVIVAILITLFYGLQPVSSIIVMLGVVLFYTWRFQYIRKNKQG